ncbi:MAG: hypothetical protein WBX15_08910 [Thermoanaerobaculia bacterium]
MKYFVITLTAVVTAVALVLVAMWRLDVARDRRLHMLREKASPSYMTQPLRPFAVFTSTTIASFRYRTRSTLGCSPELRVATTGSVASKATPSGISA